MGLNGDGTLIRVGDSRDAVESAYPRPRKATLVKRLPSGFADDLSVWGWETEDTSFAAIFKNDSLILAMELNEDADSDLIEISLDEPSVRMGEALISIEEGQVKYRFWELNGRRQMASVGPAPDGRQILTSAVGITEAMDLLRMSPEAAEQDAARAAQALDRATSDTPSASE